MSDTENDQPQGGDTDDAPLVAIVADDGGTNPVVQLQQAERERAEPTPAERVSAAFADFLSLAVPVEVDPAALDKLLDQMQAGAKDGEQGGDQSGDKPAYDWKPMEDLGHKPDGWDEMRQEANRLKEADRKAEEAMQKGLEAAMDKGLEKQRSMQEWAADGEKHSQDVAGYGQHHSEEQSGLAELNAREHSGPSHSM